MDIIAPPIAGEDFLGELSLYAGIHPSIRSGGGEEGKSRGRPLLWAILFWRSRLGGFFFSFFSPNEHFFNDDFRGFVKKDMMEIFSLQGERRSTHACAGETGEREREKETQMVLKYGKYHKQGGEKKNQLHFVLVCLQKIKYNEIK